jgi:hypothetical protein
MGFGRCVLNDDAPRRARLPSHSHGDMEISPALEAIGWDSTGDLRRRRRVSE